MGILNVEEAVKYCAMKQYESSSHKKCPKNYDTCYLFLQKCKEYAYPLIPFVKRVLMKETTSTAAYGMCELHLTVAYKTHNPKMKR